MVMTAAGAVFLRPSPGISPPHCLLSWSAAWPWSQSGSPSSPLLDVGEKSSRSSVRPEQISKLPVKQRVNVSQLLKRSPIGSDGKQKQDTDGRGQQPWLPEAPGVEKPRAVHNAAALAYMGDAVYELYVRRHFLTPPQTMDKFNQRVMALVCCEAQHALLLDLLKKKILTEEEKDVLRWGKNLEAGHKKARRRAGTMVYNSASSLETLIGYLYLTNVGRLEEIMSHMGFDAEDITPRLGNSK
ncbi:hypothetical protein Mapa_007628 [Marchantia paleacea]|nr:hypothetical protein Mapa_007628 [Marchantia paleacea]